MKWKHLQEIMATIENHNHAFCLPYNHAFYDSLPYTSAAKDKKGKKEGKGLAKK